MSEDTQQKPQDKPTLSIEKENNIKVDTLESKKPTKPPKPEDKPFEEFINEHLIPALTSSLKERNITVTQITLKEGPRPVVGGSCWMIHCELESGRQFWLLFSQKKIISQKNICLAETNSEPSLIESFLIDERKTTLALLISRILQRLNGQKWLEPN